MSPQLKPLLLPQLVEERKKMDDHHTILEDDIPYTSHTTNSSMSDILSPVTPTFSTRGHFRGSSSTSSLDLAYMQFQDCPSSPIQQLSNKASKRKLPDVEEEPLDREEDLTVIPDYLGLYSCLCKFSTCWWFYFSANNLLGDEPCEHRQDNEQQYSGGFVPDYDFDHDSGCLSDADSSTAHRSKKHDSFESPFLGLTARLSSRLNTMQRWKQSRMANLISSPTTEISFENVLSRGPSSRSSSMSSPTRYPDRSQEPPTVPTPSLSCYNSVGSMDSLCEFHEELEEDGRATLERDRAKAITPLLPPLMTQLFQPPTESPLQSPTVAPLSAAAEFQQTTAAPVDYCRPSLSSRPSVSSLRHVPIAMELPLPLPAILQEHDEWSDRLGHANFTITPQPYELEQVDSETVTKFRGDWEAARVNYTKHLVRTGENYGQTSKIYALTEAKWAETEGRWKTIYESAIVQVIPSNTGSNNYDAAPRNRSRGRGRDRSASASTFIMGRPVQDDFFAETEWQRIEDGLPSAVPGMLDAEGKFPARGDEDIVGPMHRAETMARSQSEEKHGAKFWKTLAEKVRLLK